MMRIPASNINITELEKSYVRDALESGWISGIGGYVTRFEDALAKQVQRKHAIAVSNGTVALELALKGLGIRPGDEVIVPALTFVAPAAAVRNVGATPILVDVSRHSWTLDPEKVKEAITRRTQAIIAVDLLGSPADYDALRSVASDIPIIEDAAQAHGAVYKGKAVGSLGDISTFSFFANKSVSCGEAGAVLTDDSALAEKMRLIAGHGMSPNRIYWHEIVGSNYRLSNLPAAVGLGQVERWNELTQARRDVGYAYDTLLKGAIAHRPICDYALESTWLYCVASPQREMILDHIRAKGIDARPIWTAIPDLPPYRSSEPFPVARKIAAEAFTLPTWAGMPKALIEEVAEAVLEAVNEAKLEAVLA